SGNDAGSRVVPLEWSVSHTTTSSSSPGTGAGLSSTLSITVKIADVAPMPSASVPSTTSVNDGVRSRERIPSRRSARRSSSGREPRASRTISLTSASSRVSSEAAAPHPRDQCVRVASPRPQGRRPRIPGLRRGDRRPDPVAAPPYALLPLEVHGRPLRPFRTAGQLTQCVRIEQPAVHQHHLHAVRVADVLERVAPEYH